MTRPTSFSRLFVLGTTLLVAAIICAACSKPKAAATCKPSGTALSISAQELRFDKACLAAPANESFTIAFTAKDVQTHNVAIYTDSSASKSLFVGDFIGSGRSTVYHVSGLPAGTYYFRCDHHLD